MDLPPASLGNDARDTPASGTRAMWALARIARLHGVAAHPGVLAHGIGLQGGVATTQDLLQAAGQVGLKARAVYGRTSDWLQRAPRPLLVRLRDGRVVLLRRRAAGDVMIDVGVPSPWPVSAEEVGNIWAGEAILVSPRARRAPASFGLAWFVDAVLRYRRPLLHVLIMSLFVQVFALAAPLLFQVVIDKVLTGRSQSTLTMVVAGLLAISTFDVVLQYLRSYTLSHTGSRMDVELGSLLFCKLLRLPVGYFEQNATGQTVARMREIETIRSFLTGQTLTAVVDAMFTIVFIAVLFAYSLSLACIVLGSIPVYVLLVMLLRPALRERVQERFAENAESQQYLVESVIGMATVKSAAIEPLAARQWNARLARYVTVSFRAVTLGALGQGAIQYVNKLVAALVLFFGARTVLDGGMTVGGLVAFNMIANQVVAPILRLGHLFQDFQQAQVSIERIGDILNTPPEKIRSADMPGRKLVGRIEFRRASFRYSIDAPMVLKDLSLEISAGEMIGVVGPSGSGKSTLSRLVQRLHLPTTGMVLVDGTPVEELHPAWLRRQTGVVLQENFLFRRSVHENIALANPTLSRDKVVRAAMLAGADDFIRALPDGYDTIVEERGANLSGGQRQRIAIARALVGDPRLLILDEATSALDGESENLVQSNLRRMARGRTMLIIAHRLATVRDCDRIVGIEDGRLVEQGTHDELLASGGLYARLWALQLGARAKREEVPA